MPRWLIATLALGCAVAVLLSIRFLKAAPQPAVQAPSATAEDSSTGNRAPDPIAAIAQEPARTQRELPAPGAEVAALELELIVVSADGVPVPGARLVIFRDQEILADAIGDEHGAAHFAAGIGVAEVAVFAKSWPLVRAPVGLEAGQRSVTLPDGTTLGGWAFVNGTLPAEPIELHFQSVRIPDDIARLPKSVNERLRPMLFQRGNHFTLTDAQGAFRFRGLLPDARGALSWEGPYYLESAGQQASTWEETSLEIEALRPDLELRLSMGIELRLRVVDPAGAAVPSAGIRITHVRQKERGQSTSLFSAVADDQGRYRRSLGRTPPTSLEIQLTRPDGSAAATHALVPPAGLQGIWDVGDLALLSTRTLVVLVQDSEGAPIGGAQATPQPSQAATKARSDAQGRLDVSIGTGDDHILVQALGYRSVAVEVPPDAARVVAVLAKTSLLEFKLADDEPSDPKQLSIRVFGAAPIFSDELPGELPALQVTGSTSREKEPQGTASYKTGVDHEDGRWKVASLMPGIALKAELSGRNGPVLAAVDIAPLAAAEHRIVELRLDRRPKTLRVLVQGPDQQPMPLAKVRLEDALQRSVLSTRTDANGGCEFSSLYADRYTLSVEAEGYPPSSVFGIAIPPEELTVVLEQPHALSIELVELDGSPMTGPADVLVGATADTRVKGVRTAPGRWEVKGLPSGEVTIEAVNGKFPKLSQLHDMAVPFVRIVVGHPGRVHARVALPADPPQGEWSVAIAALGSSRTQTRGRISFGPQGSRDVWFNGLEPGNYEIWLETRASQAPWNWMRVGQPVRATLDLERPQALIDLRP